MKLYELSNDVPLSTHAAAHYTRGEIAALIRSNPHSVQSLLAGVSLHFDRPDECNCPIL
jgi:hypothetical protein